MTCPKVYPVKILTGYIIELRKIRQIKYFHTKIKAKNGTENREQIKRFLDQGISDEKWIIIDLESRLSDDKGIQARKITHFPELRKKTSLSTPKHVCIIDLKEKYENK